MAKNFVIGTEIEKNSFEIGRKTKSPLLAKIWLKQGKKVFFSFDDQIIKGQVLSIDRNLIHTKSINGGAKIAIPIK